MQFQVETFDAWLREAGKLFPLHWQELTLDKDICGDPWPNEEKYRSCEAENQLFIVTARNEGKIVGYYFGAILPHLHYGDEGLLCCYTDMYFMHQDFRGASGAQLFMVAEEEARKRGAKKMYLSCKVHQDHTKLFEALHFKKSDLMFTKRLV